MTLTDYLNRERIPMAAFAERIGVSRQSLHRYTAGQRRPDWDVLSRIVRETNGEVTANDFIQLPAPAGLQPSAA